ncbi:MAG: rod shape-determining protein [Pseudobutyrivibrio sp.]|nr:rod shape-determining protein [Pseudobutyrivibrio sp.]
MSLFDQDADIKIYNYKTKKVHMEKSSILLHAETQKIAALGNECSQYVEGDTRFKLVHPIVMGRVEDYSLAQAFFKWIVNANVNYIDGKRRLFKRSNRVLIFLHEPCSEVDKKIYCDLLYELGYKNIFIISADTELGNTTPEEVIWNAEETYGKLDFAIEITKEDKYQYARYLYKELQNSCKRWNIHLEDKR